MFPGILIIVWSLLVTDPGHAEAGLPTAGFRAEHGKIHVELDETAALVGKLAQLPEADRPAAMQKIVAFFADRIVPHAGFEEKVLYPLVDQKAGTEVNLFTATMRHEHRVVDRWTGELKAIMESQKPDVVAFTRKADNLLGLIIAHFEEEEEVLLPVLDKTMSAEEFEHALHGSAHEHE